MLHINCKVLDFATENVNLESILWRDRKNKNDKCKINYLDITLKYESLGFIRYHMAFFTIISFPSLADDDIQKLSKGMFSHLFIHCRVGSCYC